MKRIIALRHAESIKNLDGIYGGGGKKLTQEGIENIKLLNRKLQEEYDIKNQLNVKIYTSCNRVHVIDTCRQIAEFIGIIKIDMNELYSPINLGKFDGLSKEEQREKYPEAVIALEKWNLGVGDINDFVVEELESASSHSKRIKAFLNKLDDNGIYILVGTRSDISALKNVVFGNNPEVYMEYKYYETEYLCGVYFEMYDNETICNIKFI